MSACHVGNLNSKVLKINSLGIVTCLYLYWDYCHACDTQICFESFNGSFTTSWHKKPISISVSLKMDLTQFLIYFHYLKCTLWLWLVQLIAQNRHYKYSKETKSTYSKHGVWICPLIMILISFVGWTTDLHHPRPSAPCWVKYTYWKSCLLCYSWMFKPRSITSKVTCCWVHKKHQEGQISSQEVYRWKAVWCLTAGNYFHNLFHRLLEHFERKLHSRESRRSTSISRTVQMYVHGLYINSTIPMGVGNQEK